MSTEKVPYSMQYINSLPQSGIDQLIYEVKKRMATTHDFGRTWGLYIPALLRRIDELESKQMLDSPNKSLK